MINDETPRDVIQKLQDKYYTPEARRGIRLNEDLVKEILSIVEELGFEVVPLPDFITANFSSTALELFEEPIRTWIQNDKDAGLYMPIEQILRELINQGWVIRPPKGV